jgi:hypothetical protein
VWEIEEIPNDHRLFLRVHVNEVKSTGGNLHPGVFREQEGSMSVDWEKYSTAEQSRNRAKNPQKVGIVALIAGVVRSIENLKVLHEPAEDQDRKNRAHSAVYGITDASAVNPAVRKTMIRSKLFEYFNQWLLAPPPDTSTQQPAASATPTS